MLRTAWIGESKTLADAKTKLVGSELIAGVVVGGMRCVWCRRIHSREFCGGVKGG